MSYILEALKKIEQKQQREGIPRLLTSPSDILEEQQQKRSLLPYVIAGALVLNILIMTAWWLAPWRPAQQQMVSSDSTATPQTGPIPTQSLPTVYESAREKYPAEVALSKHTPGLAQSQDRQAETNATTSGSTQTVKAAPSVSRPSEAQPRKEARVAPAPPKGTLLSLEDLPAAVKSNLPEFKISGHAYSSEPRFRVARVNNKIVQEGEALSQGLKVDEIVSNGVIFTFQGYRFRVGINDDR